MKGASEVNCLAACRHTEPGSGASTPDLDPFSPVDRKRALKGFTFVPDIQEIRVRSGSPVTSSHSLGAGSFYALVALCC